MITMFVRTAAASLALVVFAPAQEPQQQPAANLAPPGSELADALTRQVTKSLRAKATVGEPITAGAVTLIPILMIDINFGGAGVVSSGGSPAALPKGAAPPAGADGFLMSGEARPLGFLVVTTQGTRFISVAQAPGK